MSDVENKEGEGDLLDLGTLDTALEDVADDETVDTLKEKLAKANDKLKQFPNVIARAKTAEGKLKTLKPAQPLEKKPEGGKDGELSELKTTVDSLALAERKRQFGYENSLSPAETDAVFRINPNPTKDTLKDPFVEGGLAKLRSMNRVENNTPSASSRSGKPLKFKPDASKEDRQSAFEERMQGIAQKRK